MPPPGYPSPADQLAAGSLVKLISGGPLMTVLSDTTVVSERRVTASWFDAGGGGHYHEVKVPRSAVAPAAGDAIVDRIAQHVLHQATLATVLGDRIAAALQAIDAIDDLEPTSVLRRIRAAARILDPSRPDG